MAASTRTQSAPLVLEARLQTGVVTLRDDEENRPRSNSRAPQWPEVARWVATTVAKWAGASPSSNR